MSQLVDVYPGGAAGPVADVGRYLSKVGALTLVELQKLKHDQWDVVTRSVQPMLWLLLFGNVFGRLRVLPQVTLCGINPTSMLWAPKGSKQMQRHYTKHLLLIQFKRKKNMFSR